MESLDAKRRALRQLAAQVFGTSHRSPRTLAGQAALTGRHSEIVAFPQRMVSPIQDIDSASPTFGQFFYMLGYDGLGQAPLGGS